VKVAPPIKLWEMTAPATMASRWISLQYAPLTGAEKAAEWRAIKELDVSSEK